MLMVTIKTKQGNTLTGLLDQVDVINVIQGDSIFFPDILSGQTIFLRSTDIKHLVVSDDQKKSYIQQDWKR